MTNSPDDPITDNPRGGWPGPVVVSSGFRPTESVDVCGTFSGRTSATEDDPSAVALTGSHPSWRYHVRDLTMSATMWKTITVGCAAAAVTLCLAGTAGAQAAGDPNPGAITLTGGLDVPSVYMFRGINQEPGDPKLTLWPYFDVGVALASGDGALKSVGLNVGVWNSLHTGTSGLDGPSDGLHYEEDFYTTLSFGFGGGVTVAPGVMVLTSPNNMFNTVKEFQLRISKAHLLSPYGFLAFELSDDGQADGGTNKGSYLELGIGPAFPLAGGKATLAIPVKLGMSLKDYYEFDGEDQKFGFFDIGGLITVPFGVGSRFGSWNLHGGVDVLVLGDTTEAFNSGDNSKVVGLVGIGVTY
jgi:hypothetical protein